MIRRFQKEDVDSVIEIENRCFSRPWKYSDLDYEANSNPYAQIYVLEEDGKIIGFYDLWVIFENGELARIAILPEYQHKGYGKMLMEHMEETAMNNGCETIALEVRVSNEKAINMYSSFGFVTINIKEKYYDNGEDGYRMMKGV